MNQPILEILWEMPHVKFTRLASGNYCLVVTSMELNDYMEDFLWDDYDFHATSVALETPGSIPVYYNELTPHLPVAKFIEALNRLDPEEVKRIYQLTNR
jgi:hypothetical protein